MTARRQKAPRATSPADIPPADIPGATGLRGAKLTLAVVAVAFAVDRAVKWGVVEALDLKNLLYIPVAPPWLNLMMAWNRGANFGLGAGLDRMFWIGLTVMISVGLLAWSWRMADWRHRVCVGLLVGGAIGNALDRWIYGAVADFLNMSCCGFSNPYAFNPADVFIFAGAMGLVALGGGTEPDPKPKPEPKAKPGPKRDDA
jgi:signal peptidase II